MPSTCLLIFESLHPKSLSKAHSLALLSANIRRWDLPASAKTRNNTKGHPAFVQRNSICLQIGSMLMLLCALLEMLLLPTFVSDWIVWKSEKPFFSMLRQFRQKKERIGDATWAMILCSWTSPSMQMNDWLEFMFALASVELFYPMKRFARTAISRWFRLCASLHNVSLLWLRRWRLRRWEWKTRQIGSFFFGELVASTTF